MTAKHKPTTEQGVQATLYDFDLLQRLVRYQGTTVPVLLRHVFVGHHRSGVYARLRRLVRAGLLEDLRTGPSNLGRPRDVKALYVPTSLAYRMLGADLAHRPISLATTHHTLAVSEIGLAAERLGFAVTTDREMRRDIAEWRQSGERHVPLDEKWMGDYEDFGVSSRTNLENKRTVYTHRPDLVLLDEVNEMIAVEVELTKKSNIHLGQILRRYGKETKYREVRYHVADHLIEAQINRVLDDLPPEQRGKFKILRYVPMHSIEPTCVGESSPFGGEDPTSVDGLPDAAEEPSGARVLRSPATTGTRVGPVEMARREPSQGHRPGLPTTRPPVLARFAQGPSRT